MTNIAENIKNIIVKEKIEQIPSWVFWSKTFALFLFFIVSLLIGAFAFSLVLHSVLELGFENMGDHRMEFLYSIPWVWFLFFSIFSVLAIFGMKHLPKAYKINSIFFIIINLGLSLLLGALFYFFNFPEHFRYFHNNLEHKIEEKWNHPEKGFLSGKIIQYKLKENIVKIKTINNEIWEVKIKDTVFLNNIKHTNNDKINKIIKIKGYILKNSSTSSELSEENKNFIGEKIMPLKRNRFKRHFQKHF